VTTPDRAAPGTVATSADGDGAEAPRRLLDVRNVTKRFGGSAVVDDVSFSIDEREAVGLIGANGAGKTTVFRMIAGELTVTRGSILFDGAPLPRRPDARARLGIGRTFQLLELFGGLTVRDHLLVALQAHERRQGPLRDLLWQGQASEEERDRCDAVVRLCGLGAVAEAPATALSLGQRRAVELARALVTRPRLVLADEPSSGLDQEEARWLAGVLARVRAETQLAVLLVEHDLATVEAMAERVVAMDAGRVIAHGTFDDVVRDPQVVASWLGGVRS
jgi:ABC-type branched-subunit amino acid transport system ATPase component